MLTLKWTSSDVHIFQTELQGDSTMGGGGGSCNQNPSIHYHIEAFIVPVMTERNIGYIEQVVNACANSNNSSRKITDKDNGFGAL